MTDPSGGGALQAAFAAINAGDLGRAIGVAGAALERGEREPLFFKLRAIGQERQGRLAQAIDDFRAALSLVPDDFAALSSLGLLLARAGRAPEGLRQLDASIAIKGDYAPAHCNRAWALEATGDRAGARAAYEQALAIDPTALQALGGLAAIAARSGAMEAARDYARRALAISPRDPAASIALAKVEISDGEPGGAAERMRALLDDAALPQHERGVASTVLGDALDAAARPSEAFEAYLAGNAALAAVNDRPASSEARAGLPLALRLADAFADAAPSDWRKGPAAETPPPCRAHLFVVGFPRSGTTLIGQALAAHPETAVLDEQETLAEPAQAFLLEPGGLDRLAGAGSAELTPFRQGYWRRIADAADVAGRVFVDKLPMNVLGLPLIAKLFPDARVLVVRRDPRDVVLSCFRRQFVQNGAMREFFTLEGAARFYDAVMRLTELYLAKVELNVRVQRYEDLVADFAGQGQQICGFADLEWTPAFLDFGAAAQAREVATPSAAQIARGLYGEGVGQWRRYRQQLAPILPALAPWIERFGYDGD